VLDRTRHKHNLVQIHASKVWVRKSSLSPEEFEQLLREEDEVMRLAMSKLLPRLLCLFYSL